MKTTKWKDIRKRVVTPDDEPQIQSIREIMRAEQRLAGLRRHRHMSQEVLAEKLSVSQSSVSQFEHAEDMRLSTLENYVKALGGHLEIRAVFDDETLPIS